MYKHTLKHDVNNARTLTHQKSINVLASIQSLIEKQCETLNANSGSCKMGLFNKMFGNNSPSMESVSIRDEMNMRTLLQDIDLVTIEHFCKTSYMPKTKTLLKGDHQVEYCINANGVFISVKAL